MSYRRMKIIIITVILQCIMLSACSSKSNNAISTESETISTEGENNSTDVQVDRKEYVELEIEYSILLDGTAEVTGYSGEGNRATIDMDYDGHDVIRIADSAFEGCTSLETVLFWADVEEIGDSAFKGCTSLSGISIPTETKNIAAHAFEGCSSLKDLVIWGDPDIGDYAFSECTSLEEVSLSIDTKNVGEHAFDGCTSLTTVTVWNDDTKFGYEAFANCPNLKERPKEEATSIYAENETDEMKEESISLNNTEITVTMSEDEFKGMNYKEAEKLLNDMGFTNFKYQVLETEDQEKADDTIGAVEIKSWDFGKGDFSVGDIYDSDAIVVLWYYDCQEQEPNLTIDNCADLAALVTLKDPSDSTVPAFAGKYAGKTIEFDGCVTAMQNHGEYKTRYDILINTGDFDTNTVWGPNFRFTDVNASDMDLKTLDVTEVLSVGQNVHVIAKVGKYDANNSLFELDAIKVEVR